MGPVSQRSGSWPRPTGTSAESTWRSRMRCTSSVPGAGCLRPCEAPSAPARSSSASTQPRSHSGATT
eukprot:4351618-Alexandrium_andersonii.AAC.1